jgi:CBS domain-containing protein
VTKARDIMTSSTEFVGPDTTVADAAKRMAQNDVGALAVCGQDKRLRGVITDRDIVVGVIAQGKDPMSTTVGDVTPSTEVVTIGADDSIGFVNPIWPHCDGLKWPHP